MSDQPKRGNIFALTLGALIGAGVGFYYMDQERQRVQVNCCLEGEREKKNDLALIPFVCCFPSL